MSTSAVIGSTGLVGSHILTDLLASQAFSTVYTISRRAPKSSGAKLNPIIEAETTAWPSKLSSIQPTPRIIFSALGTTRAAAGGIANQWKIDHDLNIELAKAAKAAGVKIFVFISSAGTRSLIGGSAPYGKMKVGVEDAVKELDFETSIILRPGLIMGARETEKAGGSLMNTVVKGLGRLSQGLQDSIGQDGSEIGRAAVAAAALAAEGKAPSKYWVVEAADIIKLGRIAEPKAPVGTPELKTEA